MRFLNQAIKAAENIGKYLKLFECLRAGFEAFAAKARENGLYTDELPTTEEPSEGDKKQ